MSDIIDDFLKFLREHTLEEIVGEEDNSIQDIEDVPYNEN